jgi:hypothetical protein
MVTEEIGMATETRHAAWQTERRFAVRLRPEGGPPTELAEGLAEFLDAFDLAFEWLDREDPARTGSATLSILETCDGVSEEVWTYPPAPANGQELVSRLGFNPVSWAGVPGFSAEERKTRLRSRVGASDPREDEAPSPWVDHVATEELPPSFASSADEVVVASEPEPERELKWEPAAANPTPAVRDTPRADTPRVDSAERPDYRVIVRRWVRAYARAAWDDRVSRCCLVLTGATLWFALGLADPRVLAPLLVLVPTLWWRERNREEPTPDSEIEDWL